LPKRPAIHLRKKLTKKQKDNLYKKYYDTELAKMIIANGGELKKVKK